MLYCTVSCSSKQLLLFDITGDWSTGYGEFRFMAAWVVESF